MRVAGAQNNSGGSETAAIATAARLGRRILRRLYDAIERSMGETDDDEKSENKFRKLAAQAIGRIGDKGSFATLKKIAEKEGPRTPRRRAVEAIELILKRAYRPLPSWPRWRIDTAALREWSKRRLWRNTQEWAASQLNIEENVSNVDPKFPNILLKEALAALASNA